MLPATTITAALLGLIYLALSYRVSQVRLSDKVSMGDGGNETLIARMRAHANFAEYVPLILILMALIELARGAGAGFWLWLAGAAIVIGRLLHAWGMALPAPNKPRIGGTLLTWTTLALLSLWAFVLAATTL